MPLVDLETIRRLQRSPVSIRNVCILAHVDHGKTTLADRLLVTNGILSSKLAGKMRFMDSRPDEQERGITMKSSAISLYFKILSPKSKSNTTTTTTTTDLNNDAEFHTEEYLINLIDSPGHVDFTSEVSTAARLSDGALVIVDAVEGVCTQTQTVLRQAFVENIRPVLVLNKIDRIIAELKFSPHEAFLHLNNIIQQVNAVMASFAIEKVVQAETRKYEQQSIDADHLDTSFENAEDKLYFMPERGNVIFASAVDGWAFRVRDFARIFAPRLGMDDKQLAASLWGDYYYDPKSKTAVPTTQAPSSRTVKLMPVQFMLEPIWAVYEATLLQPDKTKADKIIQNLNLKIPPRDLKSKEPGVLLQAVMNQWLSISTCILVAIVDELPNPIAAQASRTPTISCLADDKVPVVAFISKIFSVPVEAIVRKRENATPEELRERRRLLLEKKALGDDDEDHDVSIDVSMQQLSIDQNNTTGDQLIGFARIFSGTLKTGQQVFLLGPKYDPADPTKFCQRITVSQLYLMMGRDLEELDSVPAGNIFAIGGLHDVNFKYCTVSNSLKTESLGRVTGSLATAPILRVAVEPRELSNMSKLIDGLKLLNQADPCVEVSIQESGEHIIATAGELHLERCLTDLRERFAKIDLHVSEPIIPYRETIRFKSSEFSSIQNKQIHIEIIAAPIPEKALTLLQQHADSIRILMDEKLTTVMFDKQAEEADRTTLSAELLSQLDAIFKNSKEPIFHDIMSKIWSFGPKRPGTNMLVNLIDGYTRTSNDVPHVLSTYDNAIVTGFQLATNTGPLCAEPMSGVCFFLKNITIQESNDDEEQSKTVGGQMILAVKEACHESFLAQSPRLLLAMYQCDIQATSDVLGKVYGVISKRRGRIVSEEMNDGTSFFHIRARIPVAESIGFATELRKRSSGVAHPQLSFVGWELLDQDPFWVPSTEDELEDYGEKADRENIAKAYVDKVRKRKGLFVEQKIVEHAEKQRTLKIK